MGAKNRVEEKLDKERERERGGEYSKRGYRKIDYENRFEELEEKELSKRFLSSFCIREINRGKKIGKLYLCYDLHVYTYYVFLT